MIYRNVNYALADMPFEMIQNGTQQDSRNGRVLALDSPFLLTTEFPTERVLLCPKRRANPWLFLLDGLSILSAADFVKPLADIAPRFRSYSDDGVTLRGHYGRRLRPQIDTALQMFREQPNTRRVAMQIWDRAQDLGVESRDIPCNVMVLPRIVDREHWDEGGDDFVNKPVLDLTVVNRSNDLFWGMLGANIVQFSFLQEYMAAKLGIGVGRLHQFSTNLHAYLDMGPGKKLATLNDDDVVGPFTDGREEYPPVVGLDTTDLTVDLDMMFLALADGTELPLTRNFFLRSVVYPMIQSWRMNSLEPLQGWPDCDWFHAARMYMEK